MKNSKGIIALILVVVVLMVSVYGCFGCESDMGGDGTSSCKNCGRSPVYSLGYCKSCYNGFRNWQKKNGY